MHFATSGIARRSRHKWTRGPSWWCTKSTLYDSRESMVAIVAALMLAKNSVAMHHVLVNHSGLGAKSKLTTGR
jgi:hypothetical protein